MAVSTHKRWVAVDSAATATISVADGDDATNGQFTEGTSVTLKSHDGTIRVYVLCDGSESGASATGTVLTAGSDTGVGTLSTATAALGTCVAFQNNLNTINNIMRHETNKSAQYNLLIQIKSDY